MKPTGERADRKRQAIVTAAREVFLRDGYGAGMDTIAKAADVSKVTVYNHFGSKDALFTAVVGDALDDALDSTLATVRDRLGSPDGVTTTEEIRVALTAAAKAWVKGVNSPEVLELLHVVAAEMRAFPQLTQAWRERGPGRFYPLLEAYLEPLAERGVLIVPDVTVAVLQLYSLTLYPHLVASLYGDKLRPNLDQWLIIYGVEMFLKFYRPREATA
jgi:TetR/AcrR family transcriptional regulator, mexJK operon transcriptional repressor